MGLCNNDQVCIYRSNLLCRPISTARYPKRSVMKEAKPGNIICYCKTPVINGRPTTSMRCTHLYAVLKAGLHDRCRVYMLVLQRWIVRGSEINPGRLIRIVFAWLLTQGFILSGGRLSFGPLVQRLHLNLSSSACLWRQTQRIIPRFLQTKGRVIGNF